MRLTPLVSAVCAVLAAGPAVAAEGRLPEQVKPERYRITLAIDLGASGGPEGGSFAGEETIELSLSAPVAEVVLHQAGLDILEARLGPGPGPLPLATARSDEPTERLTIRPAAPLPAGKALLSLRFRGRLDARLRGLYLAQADGQRYAVTQFEDTYARRAFPCFDEPAQKARFQLTAVVARGLAAISNTAVVRRTPGADGKTERVEFGETLPMSSYLVALAVGPFRARTLADAGLPAGPVPITVWAAPGKEALGDFALREAAAQLPRMEAWFGIPYPYGKLDLIAAPEFQFGGMENVAAIVFRPSTLLLDEKVASPAARRRVSQVVAHEIAHMWFGDLVTMAWWDDIWLNESFATWMGRKTVAALHPEWKLSQEAALDRESALEVDELASTHPVRPPAQAGAEPPETSPVIVYGKGGAVLRMLEGWLGEAAFRQGVQQYLAQHRFGNTVAADFFAALGAASGQPVGDTAERWIQQAGHPVITLGARCQGKKLTRLSIEQERFFGDGRAGGDLLWPVPVCVRHGFGRAGVEVSRETCVLLRTRKTTVDLDPESGRCADWVDGNADAAGFFRVAYDEPTRVALSRVARRVSRPEERMALLGDQLALAAAGRAPIGAWVGLLGAMQGEHEPGVLEAIWRQLRLIERVMALGPRERAGLASLAEALFGVALDNLGVVARPDEDDATRRTRATAVAALGLLGHHPELLQKAREQVSAYLADVRALDGSMADALVPLAAAHGDADLYQAFETALQADRTPEDRDRLLDGLARFPQAPQVERTLALSLSDTLRTDERDRPLVQELEGRAGAAPALSFLEARLPELARRLPTYRLVRVINGTAALCDGASAERVAALFAAHPPEHARLALALSLERIRVCAALRERTEAPLAKLLSAHADRPADAR